MGLLKACTGVPKTGFHVKPPTAKPFQLTYLARGGTPSENLNHCLPDILLIVAYRHILALPEYKLKVVNVCEMHGKRGIKVLVLRAF